MFDCFDELTDVAPCVFDGPLLRHPHPMLDLREGFLDGIEIGRHDRQFGRGEIVYIPWHYVPVLARKPGALHFVHDQLATGRKLRILTIVDTYSRFSPATDPRFSYKGEDVVQTLERVCAEVGYPKTIRVDNGSEFISRDLDLWAYANDVILDFSRPGKPTDNAYIESFNGSFRNECLNTHWFMSLDDAREKLEAWRRDYNTVRPHNAIGNKPPISLLYSSGAIPAP